MDYPLSSYHHQAGPAKTRYGYCDSYFVESHEEEQRRIRQALRENERQAQRQVQVTIAERLSEQASQEYRDDHLQQMEQMELETLPDVASIDIQTEIKWYMRPYLLDFLIEAHAAFGLLPETLFLTVNLLDRYCSRRIVYKKHYQLVGCAALLIASKYGDRKDRVPTIKELKSMCCSLYEDDMFLQMEWHVLQTLNWVVGHPTVDNFLQIAVERQAFDPEVEHMASYIAEIALFQREFVGKKPSDMARSSLALARCILGRPQEHFSQWAGQFDSNTLMALAQQLDRPSTILSRKYSAAHLGRVALILDDYLLRQEEELKRAEAEAASEAAAKEQVHDHMVEEVAPAPVQLPATPSKNPPAPTFNHGCPTPPDTPTDNPNAGSFVEPPTSHPLGIRDPRPPTPTMSFDAQPPTPTMSFETQPPPFASSMHVAYQPQMVY